MKVAHRETLAQRIEQLGKTEVRELRAPVGSDQDVLRLDVAVEDSPCVGDSQALEQRLEDQASPVRPIRARVVRVPRLTPTADVLKEMLVDPFEGNVMLLSGWVEARSD